MNYPINGEPVPGSFDHRGMDCLHHGPNVPHARARGADGKFTCVKCLLDVAKKWHGFPKDKYVQTK